MPQPQPQPRRQSQDRSLVARVAAIERNTLAWERTALTLAGVGALLVHAGRTHIQRHLVAGIVLEVLALVVVVGVAPLRHRAAVRDVRAERTPARPRLLAAASLTLAALAVAVAVVELVG